jgi:nuclear transport factor 2 (NTF2) superfamily protein
MTAETAMKRGSSSISEAEAKVLLASYERLFSTKDIPAIMAGFSEDVSVKFADQPELHGKPALEAFLTARFARQTGYRLTKTLRCVAGNLVVGTWDGDWTDAKTGKRMLGRGTELLYLQDGLCTKWDATFNTWEEGAGPSAPLT